MDIAYGEGRVGGVTGQLKPVMRSKYTCQRLDTALRCRPGAKMVGVGACKLYQRHGSSKRRQAFQVGRCRVAAWWALGSNGEDTKRMAERAGRPGVDLKVENSGCWNSKLHVVVN